MKKLFLLVLVLPLLWAAKPKKFYKIPKEFAFIPMGTMDYKGESISLDAFVMQKTEVSNKDYRAFLNDLKEKGDMGKLSVAQIDSVKWRVPGMHNEPFVEYYHKHPAYDNYPVVNVSREAAELYCEWLSNVWEKEHGQKVIFRLPSEYEWAYAAKGGVSNIFPWDDPYVRNEKGEFRANFRVIYQSELKLDNGKVTIAGIDSAGEAIQGQQERATITAPVDSYWPNSYGLYNMAGNVAELTSDGAIKGGSWLSTGYYLRIEAESEYSEDDVPSPFVGFRVMYTYLLDE